MLGLNLLTGFNGQISLGHGAFFALGAYIAAILMTDGGWPYWATLPVVAILCFGAGFLFGFPALKLEGHYLALATFTLAIAVPQLLKHKAIAPWTGGVAGLVLDKPDAPFGLPLSPDQWLLLFLPDRGDGAVLGRVQHAARAQRPGHDGDPRPRAWPPARWASTPRCTRPSPSASALLYTGLAGALSAITVAYVAPDSFALPLSIAFLVGLVVGGLSSLSGCIIGGIFLVLVQNSSQSLSDWMKATFDLRYDVPSWAIYGVLLLLLMYVMPTGVAGGCGRLYRFLAQRRPR